MAKFLSFEHYNDDEVKEFISMQDRKFLATALYGNKAYSKLPGVKGFRIETITQSTVTKIFFNEIKKNKKSSFLGNYILDFWEHCIKKNIGEEIYDSLVEGNYTNDDLIKIIDETGSIEDAVNIISLLGINKDEIQELKVAIDNKEYGQLLSKYENLSEQYDEVVSQNGKYKDEIDALNKEIHKLQGQIQISEDTIEQLNDDLLNLKKQKETYNIQEFDINVRKTIEKTNNKNIQNLYEKLHLSISDNFVNDIFEYKTQCLKKNDYESLNIACVLEMIMINIKECMDNANNNG